MICKRVKEQIPEYLSGGIEEIARARLLEHLDGCAACREEVAKLDTVWRKMEILEAAEPSPALRPRFHEMLAAYQCGLAANQAVTVKKSWFTVPFSVWAAAACASLLLFCGAAAGRYAFPAHASDRQTDYAQLKGEVESMRQLVTLSLLEQQSSGARLRGMS